MEVPRLPQLGLDPTGVHAIAVLTELAFAEIAVAHRRKGGLGGQHAALDRQVNALEALRVEKTGGVAHDHPSLAGQWWNGVPAAVGDGLGAVADHLSTGEHP